MAIKLLSGGIPTPFPSSFNWTLGLSVSTDTEWAGVAPAKDVRQTNSIGIDYQRVFDPADATLGSPDWMVNEYSRHQAFNVPDVNGNSSRIAVLASDNFWHIYNINLDGNNEVTTVTYAHPIVTGGIVVAEPTWDPTDPDILTFVGLEASSLVMYQWHAGTQTLTTKFDWTTLIRARHPAWSDAVGIGNIDEGMYSDDGRYAAFLVRAAGFAFRGLVCCDLQTNTILGSIDGGTEPNYISMSPSGAYVTPGWYTTGGPTSNGGAWRYDKDFTNPVRISVVSGEHADNCKGADGDDYHVSWEYGPTSFIAGYTSQSTLYAVNMRTQAVTTLYSPYDVRVTDGMHYSGRAINIPGYCLVSHYDINNRDGIFLVNIHDGTIRQIGWSHINGAPSYYHQPHLCISPSGKHAIGGSNADGPTTNPFAIMYHIPHLSLPPAI